MQLDNFMTITEASELTGLTRQAIHRWVKGGRVKFHKIAKVATGSLLVSRADILLLKDNPILRKNAHRAIEKNGEKNYEGQREQQEFQQQEFIYTHSPAETGSGAIENCRS